MVIVNILLFAVLVASLAYAIELWFNKERLGGLGLFILIGTLTWFATRLVPSVFGL